MRKDQLLSILSTRMVNISDGLLGWDFQLSNPSLDCIIWSDSQHQMIYLSTRPAMMRHGETSPISIELRAYFFKQREIATLEINFFIHHWNTQDDLLKDCAEERFKKHILKTQRIIKWTFRLPFASKIIQSDVNLSILYFYHRFNSYSNRVATRYCSQFEFYLSSHRLQRTLSFLLLSHTVRI